MSATPTRSAAIPRPDAPTVGLFVTCLADLFRPSVGFAALKLLDRAGCRVSVPEAQTCCGQPAYNAGDRDGAIAVARRMVDAFSQFDYVVAPSGSCAGMLRVHYPDLLREDAAYAARAVALAAKSFELISFLVDVMGIDRAAGDGAFQGVVTYHDACSGLRELGIREQPRALLKTVPGLELREAEGGEECCGFGGTFCVKYPEISERMADDKITRLEATGAATVLGGDLGCLLNLAGRSRRRGKKLAVRHVAEILAGVGDAPPLGMGKTSERER